MAATEAKLKFRSLESYVTARNHFFQWVMRWYYRDPTVPEVPEGTFRTPDFAFLVSLLEAIGFDLQRVEKLPGGSPTAGNGQEQPAIYTIIISCAQSGLNAVLRTKSGSQGSSISNCGNTVTRGNVQDPNERASCLLPNLTPGTALVARDIISQLMQLFGGSEQIGTEAMRACNSWTCPPTKPQIGIPPCQRRLSLETHFPINFLAKSLQPQPQSPLSDEVPMEFEDNIAGMCESSEALASDPQTPLHSASPASQPELIRQKTWSIGSIHELDDTRVVMAGPTRTSSPVQSQKTTQDLDEMRLQARNPEVAERLLEACKKIQEAMLLLNSSKDTNVPEIGATATSKSNKEPVGSVPKLRPKNQKPATSASGSSSNLRSNQRTGSLKRQRSPAPWLSQGGRRDLVTPKSVTRYGTTSTPASTPPAPRKTQENEIRSGSFINISDTTAGSPKLSPRAPNSAPGPQNCGTISPTNDSRRPSISRKSFPSLPASRSVSNLASGTTTPLLGSVPNRKPSMVSSLANTSNAPASPRTTAATNTPKAAREYSKSVLRPSLLKAPSIINRFKK